jgi:hypothetical protein
MTGTREGDMSATHGSGAFPGAAATAPDATAAYQRVPDGTTAGTRSTGAESPSRMARLWLVRLDVGSVVRVAFLFSVCLAAVALVAVVLLYGLLSATGVIHSINSAMAGVFDTTRVPGLPAVLLVTLLLGLIDVVVMTALAGVGAALFNATVQLTGGVSVTLQDHDVRR